MKINSGGRELSLCFMTPTWGRDLGHFRWLRRSLERSGLADVPHIVVVQTEDKALFMPYAKDGVDLKSTAEVLPKSVEQGRLICSQRSRIYGRRLTKFCASVNKRFSWCKWMRYAGWQVQQITKLAVAVDAPYDIVVFVDSDMLITRPFDLQLFAPDGRVTVFESNYLTPQSPGIGWRWHQTASRLLKQPIEPDRPTNGYWSPPFVFDSLTARDLRRWLENEYQLPWYESLLAQPLAGWSEGRIYTMFARAYGDPSRLFFRSNPHYRSLHRPEHRLNYEKMIGEIVSDPTAYFMNIQSDQREKGEWPIEFYDAVLSKYFGVLNAA